MHVYTCYNDINFCMVLKLNFQIQSHGYKAQIYKHDNDNNILRVSRKVMHLEIVCSLNLMV